MKTTLGDIIKFNPCGHEKGSNEGWDKLVSFLGTDDLSKEVTFRQILESNGIEDTVWALRTQPYRDYCLFCAEVSESVLYLFENQCPKDDRPRKAIEGIRRYHSGEISLDELKELEIDARNVTMNVARNVASGADVWDATSAAARAAWAATRAASAVSAASAAGWAASAAGWDALDISCIRVEKWKEIEAILLKYI